MLKKHNFNLIKSVKNLLISKSLVVFVATGLFAVNSQGEYLSSDKNKSLLLKPYKKMTDEEYDIFMLGKSFFRIPWVESPSATTARDGLGPLFDANTCVSCHPGNGRGTLYSKKGNASRSLVARASIDSNGSELHKKLLINKGFVPEPVYGSQISVNGIHGVLFEGRVDIKFKEVEVVFPDGEIDILLKPLYTLKDLNYGELHEDSNISYRIANSLNGMGLISLISDEDILKNEDVEDKNNDGISGKANWVKSKINGQKELGRFTWKASVSSLKEQVANAANNDMGLTTTLNPHENCTSFQKECLEAPKSKDNIDIPDFRLDAITYYLKSLKTYSAKETKQYKLGLKIFEKVGCVKCHISSFNTINGQEIKPFSDFLLHDMGEELSDGRVEFEASKSEFRTAPLWGLALHEKINKTKPRLLHDGRARDFQEAILWHGGEARDAKVNYMNLAKNERKRLIEFLKGL